MGSAICWQPGFCCPVSIVWIFSCLFIQPSLEDDVQALVLGQEHDSTQSWSTVWKLSAPNFGGSAPCLVQSPQQSPGESVGPWRCSSCRLSACLGLPRASTEDVLNQLKASILFRLPHGKKRALRGAISREQVSQKDCLLSRPAPGSCCRPGPSYKTLRLPLPSG